MTTTTNTITLRPASNDEQGFGLKLPELTIQSAPQDEGLIMAINELINFQSALTHKLYAVQSLVSSGAFKYSTPDKRKELINELATYADKVDDMARAVIKGVRKVKRARLRDDEIIQKLAHFWAQAGGAPLDVA